MLATKRYGEKDFGHTKRPGRREKAIKDYGRWIIAADDLSLC